jgi:hypothetical protein
METLMMYDAPAMRGTPVATGEMMVTTGRILSMDEYSKTCAAVCTFGGVCRSFVPETVIR